jgi:hypothetical protein
VLFARAAAFAALDPLRHHASQRALHQSKEVRDRIALYAASSPHWRAGQLLADAQFKRLCGQLESASADFEACLRHTEPDPSDPARVVPLWPAAAAGHIETLIELGRSDAAKTFGMRTLEQCSERGIVAAAVEVARAVSLAQAKLGEFDAATERLSAVIELQLKLGVTGLMLGASYEARARIAIWARDEDALNEYGALTAREYRRGAGSALGACYERLMDEARVAFPHRLAAVSELDPSAARSGIERQPSSARLVSQVLRRGRANATGRLAAELAHRFLEAGDARSLTAAAAQTGSAHQPSWDEEP